MENVNYVPLGSVVYLNGGVKKLLVVARAINVAHNGTQYFFDYGGVLYPEGITSNRMAYFNHGDISSVFFTGCEDAENKGMVEAINKFVSNHPNLVRGDAKTWNAVRDEKEPPAKVELRKQVKKLQSDTEQITTD